MAKLLGPHWRTSTAGILIIIGALVSAGASYLQGQHVDLTVTWTAILGGVGLVKAADSAGPH